MVDDDVSSMNEKNQTRNDEESYEEAIENLPNSSLSMPRSSPTSMFNESSRLNQRKSLCKDDQKKEFHTDSSVSPSHLNRSISTSTTSLNKTYSFQVVDLYLFLCTIVVCFSVLGIILYKICWIESLNHFVFIWKYFRRRRGKDHVFISFHFIFCLFYLNFCNRKRLSLVLIS